MKELLQSDLTSADPVFGPDDAGLHDLARRMAGDARRAVTAESATPRPWWKRRRTIIPLGIAGVVALTGTAVVIPLSLGVNHTWVDPDTEIPIVYTTDTGVDVSCRYGIYFGDPVDRSAADERLAEFVKSHDWTGIGQRIYEEAIANPFVPGPNDDWEVDTQDARDESSFSRATTDLILNEIPSDLMQEPGQTSVATTDCKGQLH